MENKVENLKNALIEVRKAHRLVESFQERMLSLVNYIATRLDFHQLEGIKHFSAPISPFRGGDHLKIHHTLWAWDWCYSYLFEYYVGNLDLDDSSSINLSIIQYADTGFFENENEDRTALEFFASPEESGSKLLFFMEYVPQGCHQLWSSYTYTAKYVLNKEFGSIKHKGSVIEPEGPGKNKILLYSVPLERFVDEQSTIAALKDYLDFLAQNGIRVQMV